MVPARVTRQRRQSRRTVWDRAGMGAAVISELEARQLVYINRKIGRMSSIGHSKYAVVLGLRGQMNQVFGLALGEVDFRIGDVMLQGCLEEKGGAVPVAAQRLGEQAAHNEVVR